MIRLTVLYNLNPYVDEDEFLEWRLTDHQKENMSQSGVIRSDFSRIGQSWPDDTNPPYRFMTTADWPDMESFKNDFFDPIALDKLQENLKMLKEPVFLISEILVQEAKEEIL